MQPTMGFLSHLMMFGFPACGSRKQVEEAQKDLLVELIAGWQWAKTRYVKGSNDTTTDFLPYGFLFPLGFLVAAFAKRTVETAGAWSGRIATQPINSGFPNPILIQQKGAWRVTGNELDYVEAQRTVISPVSLFRLVKQYRLILFLAIWAF